MLHTAFILWALAAASLSGEPKAPPSASDLVKVAIEVGPSAVERGGLLDFINPFSDSDTGPINRALVERLRECPWIAIAGTNPEVAVAVRWQQRRTGSPTRSKDGKRVTITFTYKITAAVATRLEKSEVEAEVGLMRTYSSNSSRREPSRSEDREGYQRAATAAADKVRAWVLSRIETFRPEGVDPGFHHKVRHKLLIIGDGLEVTGVSTGSPAEHAGLREGDRIRRVNGKSGTNDMDEIVLTWRLRQGAIPVTLEIERDSKRQPVSFDITSPRRR